jgi:hypothetical protein
VQVRKVILEDRTQAIHDVCNDAGLSYRSGQHILADELNKMNCSKVCSLSLGQ